MHHQRFQILKGSQSARCNSFYRDGWSPWSMGGRPAHNAAAYPLLLNIHWQPSRTASALASHRPSFHLKPHLGFSFKAPLSFSFHTFTALTRASA